MTVEQAKHQARQRLSHKRYTHTANVAVQAVQLAQRWGANAQKAELAAWLHDIAKEQNREQLLQILKQDGIMAGLTSERPLPIWHGPCGAILARHEFGVDDEQVLDAIACHTTGRRGMTKLDKVLFLADAISAERDYDGVEEIRRLAQTDLDAAVMAAMEENLRYVKARGKPLDAESQQALAQLRQSQSPAPKT